jgi:uncharacterized protein
MFFSRLHPSRHWWLSLPIALSCLIFCIWTCQRFLPMPKTELRLSSGAMGGMYHKHALRYAEELGKHGYRVTLINSAGSLENLQRLSAKPAQADLAFLQGGTGRLLDRDAGKGLLTIANIDVEPVWIFSRNDSLDSLAALNGKRVSIGPVGSGSRAVALALLDEYRMSERTVTLREESGLAAVEAVKTGQSDAGIFVSAIGADGPQALIKSNDLKWVSLQRTAALIERLRYLEPRLIAAGSLSPTHPRNDAVLLTTVASLVALSDTPPITQRILAHVSRQLHASAGVLVRPGEYPSLRNLEFRASNEARNVLQSGLPWWEQHLTVTQSQWLYRLLLIVAPVVVLTFIFWRALLAAWDKQLLIDLHRCYGELKMIEIDMMSPTDAHGKPVSMAQLMLRLQAVHARLSTISLPRQHAKRLLKLREHIQALKQRMAQRSMGQA